MRSNLFTLKFDSNLINYQFNKDVLKDLDILTTPYNNGKYNKKVEKIVNKYVRNKKHRL